MPRYLIAGVVQGVGFRYFVLRRARSLSLRGWVRNLPDGRVEVVAAGEPGSLLELEAELRRGPSHAEVKAVERSEISDEVAQVTDFQIR